jgi:hypothetical protein
MTTTDKLWLVECVNEDWEHFSCYTILTASTELDAVNKAKKQIIIKIKQFDVWYNFNRLFRDLIVESSGLNPDKDPVASYLSLTVNRMEDLSLDLQSLYKKMVTDILTDYVKNMQYSDFSVYTVNLNEQPIVMMNL